MPEILTKEGKFKGTSNEQHANFWLVHRDSRGRSSVVSGGSNMDTKYPQEFEKGTEENSRVLVQHCWTAADQRSHVHGIHYIALNTLSIYLKTL